MHKGKARVMEWQNPGVRTVWIVEVPFVVQNQKLGKYSRVRRVEISLSKETKS